MRVDFSEPECRNCYHCRASSIIYTKAPEQSNVIGSSIISSPVSSAPVQALGDDSVAVGSISTSSPVQALGDDSAAVGSTSTSSLVESSSSFLCGSPLAAISSGLAQSPASTIFKNCAFGSPSQSPPFQAASVFKDPIQATSGCCASAISTSSTSSPLHSSSQFVSAPAVLHNPHPANFDFSAFSAHPSPRFLRMQDPAQASGPSHNFGKPASASLFGNPVTFARPDIGISPASSSSTTTVVFGTTPVSVSSPFGPMQASSSTFLPFGTVLASPAFDSSLFKPVFGSPSAFSPSNLFGQNPSTNASVSSPFGFTPAVTSVGSAPTEAFGPTTIGFGTFSGPTPSRLGSMQAPVQATFGSGASSTATSLSFLPFGCIPAPPPSGPSLFGQPLSMPWGTNSFSTGCGIESVRSDIGPSSASSSSKFLEPKANTLATASVFGTSARSDSSPFQPVQHPLMSSVPKLTSVCASSTQENRMSSFIPRFGMDYLPGSSFNPYVPNPSVTTPAFGDSSTFSGVKTSSPQPIGFSGATTLLPSLSFSSSATLSSNYNKSHPSASHDWSHRTEQGSRYPGYAPTPDEQTKKGDIYISISASNPYLDKSHEELRWEDYKQGVNGSRPKAVFSVSTASPSTFASPSVPDNSQKTNFGTTQGNFTGSAFGFYPAAISGSTTFPSSGFGQPNAPFTGFGTHFPSSFSSSSTTFPAVSSSFQKPHETAAVSSPSFGCTVCGSTSNSSASSNFTFNGATTPPSAATSLQGLFYPISGFGPMMFGTTSAGQVTSPAPQAYPVQGYILLPFAAMSLQ